MPEAFRRPRILVAGQIPPPVCGQNLSIARVLSILRKSTAVEVHHWAFKFTPTWSNARKANLRKGLELIRVWWRLLQHRFRGRIDVILYPVGGPHLAPALRDIAILPLALICSKRVILHFRAAGLSEALPGFPGPVSFALKKIYAACNHAIVLTKYGQRDPKAAGIENISVIPNAREDTYHPEWIKKPSKNGPITILNVGLLCADKGTPQLLEAFSKIHARHPNTLLKLVGSPMAGLTEDSILKTAEQLGFSEAVEVTGVLSGEELQRTYAESDIFVFSSIAPFESFGNVLSEAMMWALPIVATDWRGNSEVLGENHGGELAETGADLSSNLAMAIIKLIEQREQWPELGEVNRRRFLECYQIETLEPALTELFLH